MTLLTLLRDTPQRHYPMPPEPPSAHLNNALQILEDAIRETRALSWEETCAVRARIYCALERP